MISFCLPLLAGLHILIVFTTRISPLGHELDECYIFHFAFLFYFVPFAFPHNHCSAHIRPGACVSCSQKRKGSNYKQNCHVDLFYYEFIEQIHWWWREFESRIHFLLFFLIWSIYCLWFVCFLDIPLFFSFSLFLSHTHIYCVCLCLCCGKCLRALGLISCVTL